MKKLNNYWTDANNNKWNASIYSKDQALKQSASLVNCSDCSRCSGCSDCSRCSGCYDCSDYKENPKRITSGLIGSRKATTYVYWTSPEDIQVVCGCFKSDLQDFEKQVTKNYPSGQYHDEYMKFIKVAKYSIKNL